MRLPNGYGSVTKLSGKRRKPYMVRITTDCVYDDEKDDYIQKRTVLGYYTTKAEALEALADYSKNPYSVLDSKMSVKELWSSLKDKLDLSEDRKHKLNKSFEMYMSGIADMRIRDVKTRHLQQIIDDCNKGYATKSVIRSVMNQIFRYAAQNDLVDKNYTEYVEIEPEKVQLERQIYTDDEVKNMWTKSNLPEYALTLILLHQGMRIKEFTDLAPDDIDLENKTLNIRKAKNKYSVRMLPIHNAVYELIARFKNESIEISRPQYYHFAKSIGHTPYDVRHTFATKCNALGIPTLTIQRIMGHKPDTLVETVYTHLTIEDLSTAINQVTY